MNHDRRPHYSSSPAALAANVVGVGLSGDLQCSLLDAFAQLNARKTIAAVTPRMVKIFWRGWFAAAAGVLLGVFVVSPNGHMRHHLEPCARSR